MSPMSILLAFCLALVLGMAALALWRHSDRITMRQTWQALADTAPDPASAPRFDPAMVADLPEAAQRYLTYSITPGTPLYPVARVSMTGELGNGTKENPGYRPMTAQQILAPPHGFVWAMQGSGFGGSDGMGADLSWTRFWLFGLAPVARAGDTADHYRSAFGRLACEAPIWAPGSLILDDRVTWEDAGPDIARFTIYHGDIAQTVDVAITPEGEPYTITIQRWSNENPDQEFREQPFGGTVSEFRDFNGYRVPTRAAVGNHFGTDAYFPFFRVDVTEISFTDLSLP